jgi:XTP/dITP diphosphohydrolase
VLVYVRHADDPQPVIADGQWHGEIIETPRGANGFGYDPHFLIPSLGKTTAELEPSVKNAHSHRGQALRALVEKLK